jgi:hypothetical protein
MAKSKPNPKSTKLAANVRTHKDKILWGVAGLLAGVMISIIFSAVFVRNTKECGCQYKKYGCYKNMMDSGQKMKYYER